MTSSPSAASHALQLSTRVWRSSPDWSLLIHGVGDGGFVWDALLPLLGPHQSAITVDLRGHGNSPRDPRQRYECETHVEDIIALIDRLEPSTLVIVGHSLGAEIAIRAAAERPHRVRGLVIVDGGPDLNRDAARALQGNLGSLPLRYERVADFAALLADRHPLSGLPVLESYAASALRPAADGGFELKADPAVWSAASPPDEPKMWQALHALACPKLLVRGGASSVLSQRNAERVCERLPDCRLATVSRAGHSVPLDNPAGLHDAIKPFLAAVAP